MTMSKDANQLVAAVFTSGLLIFFASFLGKASGLVTRVLLANNLPITGFGKVMLGYTVFGFISTIALWNIDTSLSYFVPKNDKKRWHYLFPGLTFVILVSVTTSISVIWFRDFIAIQLLNQNGTQPYIVVFALAIPANVVLKALIGLIRGLKDTKLRIIILDLVFNLSQPIFVLIFVYFEVRSVLFGFVWLFSSVISILLSVVAVTRYYSPEIRPHLGFGKLKESTKSLLVYSTPLVFVSISGWGVDYVDTFLIQYFKGAASVGYYKTVYPFAQGLLVFVTSFGFMYLPVVSELQSDGSRTKISNLYAITTFIGYIFALPIFLIFLFYPNEIIDLFYTSQYTIAATTLQLLAAAFFIRVLFGMNTSSLNAVGRTRANSIILSTTLILNVGLNWILIPTYAISGAAFATFLSYIYRNIMTNGWLYVSERIHPFRKYYSTGILICLISDSVIIFLSKLRPIPETAMISVVFFGILGISLLVINTNLFFHTVPENLTAELGVINKLRFLTIKHYLPELRVND